MFCFCYFCALHLFFTSNFAVWVDAGGAKNFCLWHRGFANGYAADYGTSRRYQKYYVIDAVTELLQNIQTAL